MRAPIRQVKDLNPLIERLAQAKVVMLGEATHGTHEFYEWRRLISEWLIVKHGFKFIAVEGDWPDGERINQWISGSRDRGESSGRQVLEGFRRWPTWMWANTEVLRLMEWLEQHNRTIADPAARIGFHGLDVYSLFESIDEVLRFLEVQAPLLARLAKARYACFDRFQRDEIAYARSTLSFPAGCEQQVVRNLSDLLKLRLAGQTGQAGTKGDTALFSAQQNARVVRDAELYYRAMVHGDENSWNIRDQHMLDTLEALLEFHGPRAKAIVWAHNTHVGDYRATDMEQQGLVNLGGLARTRFGSEEVALLGFGTHEGSVIASHAWDGPTQRMVIPPALGGSYEDLFHQEALARGEPRFVEIFDEKDHTGALSEIRGHRAIGVIYEPAHERLGNYVPTSLANRYDAFFYLDQTRALEPLILPFERGEFPETYPMGQ